MCVESHPPLHRPLACQYVFSFEEHQPQAWCQTQSSSDSSSGDAATPWPASSIVIMLYVLMMKTRMKTVWKQTMVNTKPHLRWRQLIVQRRTFKISTVWIKSQYMNEYCVFCLFSLLITNFKLPLQPRVFIQDGGCHFVTVVVGRNQWWYGELDGLPQNMWLLIFFIVTFTFEYAGCSTPVIDGFIYLFYTSIFVPEHTVNMACTRHVLWLNDSRYHLLTSHLQPSVQHWSFLIIHQLQSKFQTAAAASCWQEEEKLSCTRSSSVGMVTVLSLSFFLSFSSDLEVALRREINLSISLVI